MKLPFRLIALAVVVLLAGAAQAAAKGKAEHIVVVVWDGMRPDFITPQYTPTLYQLARDGVFFKRHHPVYISTTEVNGTAITTGMHPTGNGVIANTDYRPELGILGPSATEGIEWIRRGDMLTGGRYILSPTVAETLQKAGIPTVIAGTKPVALLHDRQRQKPGDAGGKSMTLFKGLTIPRSLQASLVKVNKDAAFPTNTTHPNTGPDGWTTRALTHGLWEKGVPKYTLLWLSEPDASQHDSGPGSPTSISALESSDKNLAEVLKMLEEKKVRDKTDVIIVSDHGFSTISRGPDITDILKKAKFKASKKFEDPEAGDVLVVALGGSVCFYVYEHDETVTRKLVEFLQGTDFTGVVFSRIPLAGTFSLDQVRLNPPNVAPDVVISMRWSADRSDHGTPGMIIADGGTKGKGTHGSLSRFDMHNTLVAGGPDFKKGFLDEMPSGNADVAPTILHLLGIKPSVTMDGRILHEALVHGDSTPAVETKTIEATNDLGVYRWRQYLTFSQVGGAIYFDEGNGEPVLK